MMVTKITNASKAPALNKIVRPEIAKLIALACVEVVVLKRTNITARQSNDFSSLLGVVV